MELTLQPEEAALLERVLTNYLSDLRMEVSSTDSYDWRQTLKRDEALIKGLIARLQDTIRASERVAQRA
ncbi:MAG: hypothetical protein ACRDI2_25720 [Chloroflexota bacterium]